MQKFFKTVAIVTVFSISEKFLGFLYRIFMSRTIGTEGIGLYQVALSVFALLLTVSCSGTPITVSRLMTKYSAEGKKDKVNKVITAGLTITLFISLPLCLIFFLFGKNFAFLFSDLRCYKIFLVVLPALTLNSLYAIFRGVFWGNKDFLPYSIIELLEEATMIIVGIILISNAKDVEDGALKAGIAVLVSYVFSFTTATIVFFVKKGKLSNPIPELKPLITSAAPITAMRTVTSLAVSLVSIIFPLRMVAAGYTNSQALSSFGAAAGQALPLLFIPTTLIGSFTLVLVPEISENFYKKNFLPLTHDVEKAIKFSSLLTCIFIPVFIVCGEEIGVIIFDSLACGTYLTASSFMMILMSLSSITTSMLNSIGLEHKTLLYYIISGIFMFLAIWFLPKILGVYALLLGFTFVYGITTILNLKLLNKNCPYKPKYKRFLLKTIGCTLPTIVIGFMLEKLLLPLLGIYLTFFVCAIIMVVFICLLYCGMNLVSGEFIKTFKFKKRIFKKA